jgi:hypothetical protein
LNTLPISSTPSLLEMVWNFQPFCSLMIIKSHLTFQLSVLCSELETEIIAPLPRCHINFTTTRCDCLSPSQNILEESCEGMVQKASRRNFK